MVGVVIILNSLVVFSTLLLPCPNEIYVNVRFQTEYNYFIFSVTCHKRYQVLYHFSKRLYLSELANLFALTPSVLQDFERESGYITSG